MVGYWFSTAATSSSSWTLFSSASSWIDIINELPELNWFFPEPVELDPTEKSCHGTVKGKLKQPPFVGKIKPTTKYANYRAFFNQVQRGFEQELIR